MQCFFQMYIDLVKILSESANTDNAITVITGNYISLVFSHCNASIYLSENILVNGALNSLNLCSCEI